MGQSVNNGGVRVSGLYIIIAYNIQWGKRIDGHKTYHLTSTYIG